MTNIEAAYLDYMAGMKYKEIADKYEISINTVRSWQRRNGWVRSTSNTNHSAKEKCAQKVNVQKKCATKDPANLKMRNEIKNDLIEQLNEKGAGRAHFIDLVNDYMALWDIKNLLNEDIKTRGTTVNWNNNLRKNDSITEFHKTNAQMLRILSELDLKVRNNHKAVFSEEDEVFDEI